MGLTLVVHSYTIVHYGAAYLSFALRSVYDHVDSLHVLYSPHPSHGHKSTLQPPETRDEILLAAFAYDPQDKISWYDTDFQNEGPQRDFAVETCRQAGADLILVLDSDEVWSPSTLQLALYHVGYGRGTGHARNWLINFTTLWRSFNWVCHDNMWPVRVIDLRQPEGTGYIPKEYGPTFHFGYAVSDKIMSYKMSIHGHVAEWRPDWYAAKWQAWPPVDDCHPTCLNTWHPAPFEREELPLVMRKHPFYRLEKIE